MPGPFPPFETDAQLVPLPDLGDRVPKRGGAVSRAIGRAALRLMGWTLGGTLPNLEKFVLVAAHHTSNWDGVVGIAALMALGLDARFIAKHTLFRPPLGWFLRWVGAEPVDRSAPGGLVGAMVREFQRRERFVFGVTPEGTRRKVERWRTGFYHIALGADVPIVLAAIDYGRKWVGAGPVLQPSGDLEADLERMRAFFAEVQAKNPENTGAITA